MSLCGLRPGSWRVDWCSLVVLAERRGLVGLALLLIAVRLRWERAAVARRVAKAAVAAVRPWAVGQCYHHRVLMQYLLRRLTAHSGCALSVWVS